MKEAMKEIYQVLLTEPHTPTVCTKLERIAREALAQPEQPDYKTLAIQLQQAQPEQEPDRFCDANCSWSDHHPDCKYGTQNSDELTVAYMSGLYDGKKQAKPEQPKVRTGDCLLVGVCASEGHKIAPQRTWVGLTEEEIDYYIVHRLGNATKSNLAALIRLCEAKLKEKNT